MMNISIFVLAIKIVLAKESAEIDVTDSVFLAPTSAVGANRTTLQTIFAGSGHRPAGNATIYSADVNFSNCVIECALVRFPNKIYNSVTESERQMQSTSLQHIQRTKM